MTEANLNALPAPGNDMGSLKDTAWLEASADAELGAGGVLANGFQKRGWMKTWPELETHSHYMQMRSLVLRGFDAILCESDLGVGYQAASGCGKNLVFERLFEPGDAVKAKLLELVEGEKLGPRVELTPERSAVIRSVLQEVLTAEDWAKIAQAAAQQVQQQVMDLCVA